MLTLEQVSGTVEIVYPTGSRAYVTSTTIWNSQSTVTTTIVTASGSKVGTVLVEMPAGYSTTTINSGTASTPITTTLQTASGTATGLVEVIYSEGYTTVYTNIASNSAAYTTTIAKQNPSAPGTVLVGQPSSYTTVTTLSGTVSSTTTVQPSAPAQGTVVVENPAASQAACGNQGMQWAYWNNTQGANGADDNGVTDGYNSFDPTVYKNQQPWYNATTGGSGGINNPSTNVAVPISIYGVPGCKYSINNMLRYSLLMNNSSHRRLLRDWSEGLHLRRADRKLQLYDCWRRRLARYLARSKRTKWMDQAEHELPGRIRVICRKGFIYLCCDKGTVHSLPYGLRSSPGGGRVQRVAHSAKRSVSGWTNHFVHIRRCPVRLWQRYQPGAIFLGLG